MTEENEDINSLKQGEKNEEEKNMKIVEFEEFSPVKGEQNKPNVEE